MRNALRQLMKRILYFYKEFTFTVTNTAVIRQIRNLNYNYFGNNIINH